MQKKYIYLTSFSLDVVVQRGELDSLANDDFAILLLALSTLVSQQDDDGFVDRAAKEFCYYIKIEKDRYAWADCEEKQKEEIKEKVSMSVV